jgi:type II secretory pathway pseudopilin PulG
VRARLSSRGFTYLGLLALVALIGIFLAAAARVWTLTEQRERETQLLFAGDAIRMAIGSYFISGHQFPPTLESLLKDERFPVPKHHLRRLYLDPMTGDALWTLIRAPDGVGIIGVASASKARPIKIKGFTPLDADFADRECYCDWKFIYQTRGRLGPAPVVPGADSPGASGPFLQPGSPTTAPGISLPTPTAPAVPAPTEPDTPAVPGS